MAYFGKILRNYADHSFGTVTSGGRPLPELPRSKHAFVVKFYTTRNEGSGKKAWRDMLLDLSLIVQTCDLPSYQFDTQTLNQYNRKRIIQTKVNWNPISIKFIDTRDNKFQTVLEEYFAWYYKDGREMSKNYGVGAYVPDVVMDNPAIDKFGFQPPFTDTSRAKEKRFITASPPNTADDTKPDAPPGRSPSKSLGTVDEPAINFEKYFFSKIEIIRQYGGRNKPVESPVTVFNPTITSVQHDTLDYSTAQPITWTVQFAYEGVSYGDQKVPDNNGPDWISRGASAVGNWYDEQFGSQGNDEKQDAVDKTGKKLGFDPSASVPGTA